jgi:hypothetical protein
MIMREYVVSFTNLQEHEERDVLDLFSTIKKHDIIITNKGKLVEINEVKGRMIVGIEIEDPRDDQMVRIRF